MAKATSNTPRESKKSPGNTDMQMLCAILEKLIGRGANPSQEDKNWLHDKAQGR
jgi:hypothetical protein